MYRHSATDEVGHMYGPNSHEVFDNALRHDKMLSYFFSYLNKKIGLKNCVIVLTADHGIAPIPEYKRKTDPEVKAVRISSTEISVRATRMLNNTFGETSAKWITSVIDAQIYLNRTAAKDKGVPLDIVSKILKDSLTNDFPVDKAYIAEELLAETDKECFCDNVKKSFYPPRAGDVLLLVTPFSIIDGSSTGTNHGMPYSYDTHVPLIFSGKGIVRGEFNGEATPLDIMPTLAKILKLRISKECQGNVLNEALR